MAADIRLPAVAGQFYGGTESELREDLAQGYLSPRGPGALPAVNREGPREILGLVSPHAGYVYSGPVAATAFWHLAQDGVPGTVVVVGFSHRPLGEVAVQTAGAWRTPLGDAQIDTEVAEAVAAALPEAATDPRWHAAEHSVEVQVPFLQHLYGEALRLVPVMMDRQDAAAGRELGAALAGALAGRDAVIVASTDMTHYEPAAVAREQDMYLAQFIVDRDAEGLLRERERRGITMCGAGPVAAMLWATEALGAGRAEILAYHHSGEVAAMPDVVGYLAAKVMR